MMPRSLSVRRGLATGRDAVAVDPADDHRLGVRGGGGRARWGCEQGRGEGRDQGGPDGDSQPPTGGGVTQWARPRRVGGTSSCRPTLPQTPQDLSPNRAYRSPARRCVEATSFRSVPRLEDLHVVAPRQDPQADLDGARRRSPASVSEPSGSRSTRWVGCHVASCTRAATVGREAQDDRRPAAGPR